MLEERASERTQTAAWGKERKRQTGEREEEGERVGGGGHNQAKGDSRKAHVY